MATTQKQLVTSGSWLFRWRSYLPLFFLLLFIPAFIDFTFPYNLHTADFILEMICLAISFLGLFIRCFTIGYTPRGTSGRNTKEQIADSLNTTGIYSVVRNPLYLGNYFMIFGEKFCEEFNSYASRVPAILPKFSLWQKSKLSFYLRNVLKREYPGFFAIIVAYSARELLGMYAVYGSFKFELFWIVFLSIGFAIYMVLRYLKKST